MTDHRKVPLLIGPADPDCGPGWCAWCGHSSVGHGIWHKHCWRDYLSHSDVRLQTEAVADRDGLQCAQCRRDGWIGQRPRNGRADRRLHLDHRVPLWAIVDVPLRARRAFYGLANLQLLCVACHCDKTSAEAIVRAEMKRRREDSSSGGADDRAPSTVFDASTGTAADVSAPVGRSSKPALAAAPPESVSS